MTFGYDQCFRCYRRWPRGPAEQYQFNGGTIFVCPYCRAPVKDGDPPGSHPSMDYMSDNDDR